MSRNRSDLLLPLLYMLIVISTSAPFFLKHLAKYSLILLPFYIIIIIAFVFFLSKNDLHKVPILNRDLPWVLCIFVLAGINIMLYPISRQAAQTSTAPDAMIEPAKALIRSGADLYSVQLSDGAPVSPGPGWILLNSPFTLSGFISLLTPFYLAFCAMMISKWSKSYALVLIGLLFVSLCFLQMSFVGHDLPATGLALVGLTLALYRYHERTLLFVLLSVCIAILATARVTFIIIPIALSLCLRTMNQRRAIQLAVFSTALAFLIHLFFYLSAARDGLFYQPLHIFTRAATGSGSGWLIVGGITWAVTSIFALRHLTSNIVSWFLFLWVVIGVPYIFIGFGELIRNGIFSTLNWVAWEGKVYVMFTLPLLITAIILNQNQGKPVRLGA